ncbi:MULTISPECIES: GNAT family N-acetyltransferase [Halobacterium]|uniref:GNAT family N-acetyltransferase n=1 Tax=Halobacterium TaxID=2239 RepID=UPI00073F2251|nr:MULTISPECIES: GNAT family N-acetyltransferase [Halobacterium]MCG1002296.1 GNAT family N-acetyltransferase [Halobacterium noricense]
MYARDAKKHEEVWLLDRLDEFGFEDPAFRSRDYVLAIDEETNERAGFARFRVHTTDDQSVCEFTNIGVREDWRGRGVGAHLLEHLVEDARDQGFEAAYALTDEPEYLAQFGFEATTAEGLPEPLPERLDATREYQPDAVPVFLDFSAFEIPDRLRERFRADESDDETSEEPSEDFGIDSDSATYKYDTGG